MKILVVDDATAMRRQLVKILEDLGASEIKEAAGAEDARQILGQEEDFDVVFSDWHMPKQTGLDLLRWVRTQSRTPSLRFLMLTTEQEKAKILEAARLGLQGYLFKPAQKELIRSKLVEFGLLPKTGA